MNITLIYPMVALVALSFLVAVALFRSRMHGMKSGAIDARYFKAMSQGQPTEQMINAAKHFSNLFEVPVLFYAACITAMVLPVMGNCIQALAWAFVGFRFVHAFVHLGPNKVKPRALSFFFGFLCVLAMWAEILMTALNKS